MDRAVYGKKYSSIGNGGIGAASSWGLMLSPDVLNLEGGLLSIHALQPYSIDLHTVGGTSPSGDVTVQVGQPQVGSLVGAPSTILLLASTGWQSQITFNYRFPVGWSGETFYDQISFTAGGSQFGAILNIYGYIPENPAGINDYLELHGPDVISASTGNLNPNCPPGFCPVTFTAQLIDFEGNGTLMTGWNWTLDLQRPQGFITVRSFTGASGTPFSDFHLTSALNVSPLVNWNRYPNGNVIGRVTVSGIDSDGYPQSATKLIEVMNIPQGGRPVLPRLPGRRSGIHLS